MLAAIFTAYKKNVQIKIKLNSKNIMKKGTKSIKIRFQFGETKFMQHRKWEMNKINDSVLKKLPEKWIKSTINGEFLID